LDLERVGVHDDFFDLGGHSLQSVQLVARLTAALSRPVSVKMVFQAPTVAALAEVLQREEAQAPPAFAREYFDGPPEALPEHVTADERPLIELLDAGELAPVDSVALSYLPSGLLHVTGLDAATVIHDWCGNRPFFAGVRQTHLGRI